MFWTLLILGGIGIVIYRFLNDRDKMLIKQVDSQGGMLEKYKYLIEKLTEDPRINIFKITRDFVHLKSSSTYNNISTNFFITETFNSVEIEWVGELGTLGTHKKKWLFPNKYSQEDILVEIQNFMISKHKDTFGFTI